MDAGVRAELLLNRLDGYLPLGDIDSEDEDEEEGEGEGENQGESGEVEDNVESATTGIVGDHVTEGDASTLNPNYLSSTLTFDRNKILDASSNGVMMEWETTLMRKSAELLLPETNLRVLNVGHGMGIIDGIFQEKSPKAHHIIEAHPDVLKKNEREWLV